MRSANQRPNCTIIYAFKANCAQFVCVICLLCALIVSCSPMRFTHGSWQILPLRARKNRRHVAQAPWGWYRAFGRKEVATWDRPKIEIDLEVTFGSCNKMTVSQRLRTLDSSAPGVRLAGLSNQGFKQWLNAQHQFVDTIRQQLRQPVLRVDTATAGVIAIAAGTAAPPTLRLRHPPRPGAVAVAQAAVPARVGRAQAPPSCTPRHKCNPSRQSVRPSKEWLSNSPICVTVSSAMHGPTGRVQPRTLTTRSRQLASKRGLVNWTLVWVCR